MAGQLSISSKPVLEELFQYTFLICHRHQAVTKIAWRDNIHFFTESSRRSSIISHRHDGGQVGCLILQTSEKHGQPMSSPKGHNMRPLGQFNASQHLPGYPVLIIRHHQRNKTFHQFAHPNHHHEYARDGKEYAE